MTLVEASELLGLSYRQTKRVWSRYRSEGDAGLVHRLRGRAPNRHSPEKMKQRSPALYRERYADYGATLVAGMPGEGRRCEGLSDNATAVAVAGRLVGSPAQAGVCIVVVGLGASILGELVQMDGSHHDWFEGRRGRAVLMVMMLRGMVTAKVLRERILGIVVGLVSALCPAARLLQSLPRLREPNVGRIRRTAGRLRPPVGVENRDLNPERVAGLGADQLALLLVVGC